MPSPLPIVDSCQGCGACCLFVRSPPFAVYIDLDDGNYRVWTPTDAAELARLTSAPREAIAALEAGNVDGRPMNSPCSWLDLHTRRCRYYEHRPQICRVFELGGQACRTLRQEFVATSGSLVEEA